MFHYYVPTPVISRSSCTFFYDPVFRCVNGRPSRRGIISSVVFLNESTAVRVIPIIPEIGVHHPARIRSPQRPLEHNPAVVLRCGSTLNFVNGELRADGSLHLRPCKRASLNHITAFALRVRQVLEERDGSGTHRAHDDRTRVGLSGLCVSPVKLNNLAGKRNDNPRFKERIKRLYWLN